MYVFSSLLQAWSLPILQPPSPCRVPSWGFSFSFLGLDPLWAPDCWLLSPSSQLAGCHPIETLVRDILAYDNSNLAGTSHVP